MRAADRLLRTSRTGEKHKLPKGPSRTVALRFLAQVRVAFFGPKCPAIYHICCDSFVVVRRRRDFLWGKFAPCRDLASRSPKIRLSDPRVDHAATCPNCMSRLLVLRQEQRSRRRTLAVALAAATIAAVTIALVLGWRSIDRTPPAANTVAVSQTVDLWDTGTVRGEQAGQLQSVSLPTALIRLTIVLPRHSPPGQYLVAITRDRNGNGVVAEGLAPAAATGEKEQITTSIDLSKAHGGQYFLSTTHEQDQAAYYYPLKIKH